MSPPNTLATYITYVLQYYSARNIMGAVLLLGLFLRASEWGRREWSQCRPVITLRVQYGQQIQYKPMQKSRRGSQTLPWTQSIRKGWRIQVSSIMRCKNLLSLVTCYRLCHTNEDNLNLDQLGKRPQAMTRLHMGMRTRTGTHTIFYHYVNSSARSNLLRILNVENQTVAFFGRPL